MPRKCMPQILTDLEGYTFGLRPGLIQDSGGFCQIVSVKEPFDFRKGPLFQSGPFFFLRKNFCVAVNLPIETFLLSEYFSVKEEG